MTWLDHILRMHKEQGEERLVKIAVRVQHDMGGRGDLFMDAPVTQTFEEAVVLAQDRAVWRRRRLVDAKFDRPQTPSQSKAKTNEKKAENYHPLPTNTKDKATSPVNENNNLSQVCRKNDPITTSGRMATENKQLRPWYADQS